MAAAWANRQGIGAMRTYSGPFGGDGYVEETVITDDGVRLAVRDYRTGGQPSCTVLLLHGLCLRKESWNIPLDALRGYWGERVRIVTYDHRGHGNSGDAHTSTYNPEQLARDLSAVIRTLQIQAPVVLAGHSMGGMTALEYMALPAEQRPVDPDGLVLVATAAGRLTERGLGRLLGSSGLGVLVELIDRMPHHAAERVARSIVGPTCAMLARHHGHSTRSWEALTAVTADAVRSARIRTAVGFLVGLKHFNQYRVLKTIAAATVVISGGTDMLTPVSHAQDLATAIPGAAHVHHPAAGHMLLSEVPRSVTASINRLIASAGSGAKSSTAAIAAS